VLRLAIGKAAGDLPWRPRLDAHEAIRRTADWFRGFVNAPASARSLCEADIDGYLALACPSRAGRS
jgi:hypothetical protein